MPSPTCRCPATVDVIGAELPGRRRPLPAAASSRPFTRQFPDKVILSSETAAALSSRGEYLFPVPGAISGPVRHGRGGDPTRAAGERLRALRRRFRLVGRQGVRGAGPASVRRRRVRLDRLGLSRRADAVLRARAAPIRASSTSPGSRRTASGSTSRAGGPICRWRTSCRTGPGPGARGRSRRFTSSPRATRPSCSSTASRRAAQEGAPFEYRLRWDYVDLRAGRAEGRGLERAAALGDPDRRTTGPRPPRSRSTPTAPDPGDGRDLAFVTVRGPGRQGATRRHARRTPSASRCPGRAKSSPPTTATRPASCRSRRRQGPPSTDSRWRSSAPGRVRRGRSPFERNPTAWPPERSR